MMNILENAIDFSPDGAAIDVRVYLNKEGVVMEVRDSGVGIEDKDREYILDPFLLHENPQIRNGPRPRGPDRSRAHGQNRSGFLPGKGTTVRIVLPHPLA